MQTEAELVEQEARLERAASQAGLTRLELLRAVAGTCQEFIRAVRVKQLGPRQEDWPDICPDLFYSTPILTPFGTCFTTNTSLSATATGVTQKLSITLLPDLSFPKHVDWLREEALRTGVRTKVFPELDNLLVR